MQFGSLTSPFTSTLNQRMREYGTINLSVHTRFEAPFDHLNHLHTVIEQDCSAIMNIHGTPSVMPDHFQVMKITWNRIEDAAERHGYSIFKAMVAFGDLLIYDMARFRRDLAKLDAAFSYVLRTPDTEHAHYAADIPLLYEADYDYIIARDQEYNASWKKRGGVGAFMMLARKWDRFEPMVKHYGGFPLAMLKDKPDRIDDVQDLRRYLMLVQAEWLCHSEHE